MLVFTRRRGEAVMIGAGIEVHVLRVGHDGVRLGVVAPPEVPIHRQEVYTQIREANRHAVNPQPDLVALSSRLVRARP
jgi:carbon storage regulator